MIISNLKKGVKCFFISSLAIPADGAVVKLILCTVTKEAESPASSTEKVKAFMWQAFWLKWNKLNMFPL